MNQLTILKESEANQILAKYERILSFKDLSPSTISSYSRAVRNFLTYLQDKEFTEEDIEEYLRALEFTGLSKSAWNQVMYAIKHYVEEQCYKNFPKTIQKKNPGNHLTILPPKYFILEAIKGIEREDYASEIQDKAMMLLLFDGFLRLSELETLQEKNIDYRQNLVLVRKGKGYKDRIIQISPTTSLMVYYSQRLRKVPNPYICGVQGLKEKYLSKSYIYELVHNAGLSVGYDNWHPHLMRHAGATYTFLETKDILRVSRKLGHSKIQTTIIYLNLFTESLTQIYTELPLIRKDYEQAIEVKA